MLLLLLLLQGMTGDEGASGEKGMTGEDGEKGNTVMNSILNNVVSLAAVLFLSPFQKMSWLIVVVVCALLTVCREILARRETWVMLAGKASQENRYVHVLKEEHTISVACTPSAF